MERKWNTCFPMRRSSSSIQEQSKQLLPLNTISSKTSINRCNITQAQNWLTSLHHTLLLRKKKTTQKGREDLIKFHQQKHISRIIPKARTHYSKRIWFPAMIWQVIHLNPKIDIRAASFLLGNSLLVGKLEKTTFISETYFNTVIL